MGQYTVNLAMIADAPGILPTGETAQLGGEVHGAFLDIVV